MKGWESDKHLQTHAFNDFVCPTVPLVNLMAVSSRFQDLTFPAFVCSTCTREIPPGRRSISTQASDGVSKHDRQVQLLDSLASLLVCQGEKQVVAVGATVPHPGRGLRVLVAENKDIFGIVTEHLRGIFKVLRQVRTTILRTRSPDLLDATRSASFAGSPENHVPNPTGDIERAIVEHEHKCIIHFWLKISRRFTRETG
jgi:hypothetical protein